MDTILMAAGLGRRLGALTTARPKALVEVAGRPLLAYAMRFAREAGARRLIVVGGFHHADVAARARALDRGVEVVENADFRRGNLLSLRAGLARLGEAPHGLHLMNVDHVYRPTIARLVASAAAAATEVTAFVDRDRALGADDMKVALRDGRIAAIAKDIGAWDAGYVGMTFVPAARMAAYRAAAAEVLQRVGEDAHVERALAWLAESGAPPAVADVSGRGWLEVDEPDERARAEAVLAADLWYP